VETSNVITLPSGDEARGYTSRLATEADLVSGSDFAFHALRSLTDRGRVVDARGSTGDSGRDWRPRGDANDAAMRAPGAAGRRPNRTKTVDRKVVGLGAADERATASGDHDGAQVIFVLVMPKSVRGGGGDELMGELPRLMAGFDGRAKLTGPMFEVDLTSAIRHSAFGDVILAGLAPPSEPAAASRKSDRPDAAPALLPELTRREREVLQMILEGHPNKNIAADLRISRRTVENHRAKLMKKTGSKSLPALVRLAIAAGAMPDASAAAPR